MLVGGEFPLSHVMGPLSFAVHYLMSPGEKQAQRWPLCLCRVQGTSGSLSDAGIQAGILGKGRAEARQGRESKPGEEVG